MQSVELRVDEGMKLLDGEIPGWEQKIYRPIEVASGLACPCGQVFGTFSLGLVSMEIPAYKAHRYGFVCNGYDRDALNAEWSRRIEERLDEQERIVDELIEASEANRLAFDDTGRMVVAG